MCNVDFKVHLIELLRVRDMLIVMRFQVEDEDTVTGARVVDGDEDDDEQGVETVLGRSKLRAAAEGIFLKLLNIWDIY